MADRTPREESATSDPSGIEAHGPGAPGTRQSSPANDAASGAGAGTTGVEAVIESGTGTEASRARASRSVRMPGDEPEPDPQWYRDAIIYELHVRAFHDSDGDGIGDFRGLVQKLDYLESLGVTAIWILPFYPSPLRDDGYDIADYRDVHPSYGTLDDFKLFLDEAHKRGIRVITELVINHTSDQHPWFQRARRAPKGSRERNFYVWSDDPEKYSETRVIFQDFEPSNWTWDPVAEQYFWHRFYHHQPDLNFDNPEVHEELFDILDFWMEMGVDGMRLDAIPYLYEREGTNCENLPETHEFLKKLRAHVDDNVDNRMLLAEANQWPEDAAQWSSASLTASRTSGLSKFRSGWWW
ncbi:MAG: alpha-amylase family glycosyl hydrolase [Longimicrobiales bacterium]|nr:alpha-amylase family glycosyl hydrolase [Longimicrobiales bacterium]